MTRESSWNSRRLHVPAGGKRLVTETPAIVSQIGAGQQNVAGPDMLRQRPRSRISVGVTQRTHIQGNHRNAGNCLLQQRELDFH